MPDTNDPILEFENVSLRYEDTWALKNVSLRLCPGETHIVFGVAGSGKTTLLKAVAGLVPVDEGSIKLFGEEVTALKEHELYPLRSRLGILFQEGGLFDSLTVGENVEYPLLNQQVRQSGNEGQDIPENDAERRVREALRFVELEQSIDKFPSEVSGGMRRRVGIARAIVTEPPLVLYDSPTAGLDPITANTIMALILKERDLRDTSSLIVTHRYQDGELMAGFRFDEKGEELVPVGAEDDGHHQATRFIVMKEGEFIFFGSREELEASTDDYVKRFVRHEGKDGQ